MAKNARSKSSGVKPILVQWVAKPINALARRDTNEPKQLP